VVADSHVDMPVDKRSLKMVLKTDVLPYQELIHDLSAIMPAHVLYTKVDDQPAGFSKKWLSLLREELGFTGAIVTDDLSMKGAAGLIPNVVKRVQAALDAGCDHVLLCNRPDDLDVALDGLPKRYLKTTSQKQLQSLKAVGEPISWAELQKDARYQNAKKTILPYLHGAQGADPTAVMLTSRQK